MPARPVVAVLLAVLALSCGGQGSSPTSPGGGSASSSCSTLGQVTFVRDALQGWYFWYDRLPTPEPASFSSPEAYLDAVRYRPLDSSFSYITSKAASDAFFSDSQFIGFGFSMKRTGDLEIRIAQVFPGSPAAEAGLDRGDTLLAVDGKGIASLIQTGEINTVFGPEQIGFTVTIDWRDLAGGQRSATLAKRLVTIPTVSETAVLPAGGARVGYVHFRNFVQPSVEALNAAFAQLLEEGATDLVLDLRYNGGGLVSVAQHLASLVGGPPLEGQVFAQFTHNDKQSSRNTAYRFEAKPQALAAARLVVIATRASASASEAIVNGLRPFVEVTVVGDATFGKPVGQYGFEFCEKVLFPVSFLVTNARAKPTTSAASPPTARRPTTSTGPLADAGEASLAEALFVLRNGRCSGRAAAEAQIAARARERVPEPLARDGWRQTLNAW
jgi:carboxyl-terminal processing protease